MPTVKQDNFNRALMDMRGQATGAAVLALPHNHGQLQEIMAEARAAGVQLAVLGAPDVFVLAPIAAQANSITITAATPGPATSITTLQINDNASDALSVTYTAATRVLLIRLANVTDTLNTLTLLQAALVTALGSAAVVGPVVGTGSTQMVHGGANTRAASFAGVAAGTGVKSSTAGTSGLAIATI